MDQIKRSSLAQLAPPSIKHKQYSASPHVSFARESGALPKQRTLQITNHKAAD